MWLVMKAIWNVVLWLGALECGPWNKKPSVMEKFLYVAGNESHLECSLWEVGLPGLGLGMASVRYRLYDRESGCLDLEIVILGPGCWK